MSPVRKKKAKSKSRPVARKKKKYSALTLAFFEMMRNPGNKELAAKEAHERMLARQRKPGRPPDPEIRAIVEREGISRQAAWYRVRHGKGKVASRPAKRIYPIKTGAGSTEYPKAGGQ
jgi:predicted DNA-binding protein (UPF0251 family)